MAEEHSSDWQQEVASLAHRYWVEEGCPENRAVQHWERAEREIQRRFGKIMRGDEVPGGIPNDTGASGMMG
jgi:hypothetical protein